MSHLIWNYTVCLLILLFFLEPHQRHCDVVFEKDTFYPSLVMVQPRKTRPCLTERLLMGRIESNQTNKQNFFFSLSQFLHILV